jgi:hypothetical protein
MSDKSNPQDIIILKCFLFLIIQNFSAISRQSESSSFAIVATTKHFRKVKTILEYAHHSMFLPFSKKSTAVDYVSDPK